MMDFPLGRIRKIEIRPAAPRPPGHDDRAWKSGYEESDMDINDVLGQRLLGTVKGPGSYGRSLMSEYKCLEVSPSAQWVKLMNLDGVRFWCQRVNVSVAEILHPLKGPNEPKPVDDAKRRLPVCPDCGEQMVKAKVENEEHDWSFVWMCECEVDPEADKDDPDRDAQEAVAHE